MFVCSQINSRTALVHLSPAIVVTSSGHFGCCHLHPVSLLPVDLLRQALVLSQSPLVDCWVFIKSYLPFQVPYLSPSSFFKSHLFLVDSWSSLSKFHPIQAPFWLFFGLSYPSCHSPSSSCWVDCWVPLQGTSLPFITSEALSATRVASVQFCTGWHFVAVSL